MGKNKNLKKHSTLLKKGLLGAGVIVSTSTILGVSIYFSMKKEIKENEQKINDLSTEKQDAEVKIDTLSNSKKQLELKIEALESVLDVSKKLNLDEKESSRLFNEILNAFVKTPSSNDPQIKEILKSLGFSTLEEAINAQKTEFKNHLETLKTKLQTILIEKMECFQNK